MIRRSALLISLALSLPLRLAAEEPTGFRDLPFGAEQAEVRQKFPKAVCLSGRLRGEHDDLVCRLDTEVGEAPVKVVLVGPPPSRRFMSVTMQFDTAKYDASRLAFADRYGKPDISRPGYASWKGASTFMAIVQKSPRGQGIAIISTREYHEMVEQRQAAKAQRDRGQKEKAREKAMKDL